MTRVFGGSFRIGECDKDLQCRSLLPIPSVGLNFAWLSGRTVGGRRESRDRLSGDGLHRFASLEFDCEGMLCQRDARLFLIRAQGRLE